MFYKNKHKEIRFFFQLNRRFGPQCTGIENTQNLLHCVSLCFSCFVRAAALPLSLTSRQIHFLCVTRNFSLRELSPPSRRIVIKILQLSIIYGTMANDFSSSRMRPSRGGSIGCWQNTLHTLYPFVQRSEIFAQLLSDLLLRTKQTIS